MNKKVLGAVLVGAAAWALWPRRGSNVATGPLVSDATDWSKVYPEYAVGDADTVTFDGRPYFVLAEGQPDPIPVERERDNLAQGITMQGASPDFYRLFKQQIEDPAGRVRCSDVQPYHFTLAQAMISGQLPRADKDGRLYRRMLDLIAQNKKTAEDLQIANQVISGVAAFIPVIGAAIKLAVGTGIGEGVKGHLQNALNEAEALQSIDEIASGMGAHSPEGRMWLSNEDASKPPDSVLVHGTEVWSVGLSSMGGYYRRDADGSAVFPAEAVQYTTSTINGQTAQRYGVKAGYTFIRVGTSLRLFAMHQFGWILPWLSPLLGSDDTLRRRIAVIAAVLRAFDIVRTKTFPMIPNGKGDQQRYWYVNPKHGPMMGACLPPTAEDERFSIGLTHYDWDGTDISAGIINRNSTVDLRPDIVRSGGNVYDVGPTSTDGAPSGTPEDYGQAAGQNALTQSLAYVPSAPAPTTTVQTVVASGGYTKGYR